MVRSPHEKFCQWKSDTKGLAAGLTGVGGRQRRRGQTTILTHTRTRACSNVDTQERSGSKLMVVLYPKRKREFTIVEDLSEEKRVGSELRMHAQVYE